MSHVVVVDGDGCWVWQAYLNEDGYGQAWHRGQMRLAHVAVYEESVGPVPDGLELDHLCRTPACVRPGHLEPVTHRVNMLRGESPPAVHARTTHCPQGHPYDEANTLWYRGWRRCRDCKRKRDREYQAQRRTEARAD